ncbi:hypothetical protein GDO81_006180 [Engystomops pustulosus]|uniref:Uncharacterized protein n=1 Tax=Engystomops pustulosus TaxID=76066 RepID=A0AAV7CY79_ENGPU|nr:hypothetical protein GDO81_006180 [Engystomops pustulosus]
MDLNTAGRRRRRWGHRAGTTTDVHRSFHLYSLKSNFSTEKNSLALVTKMKENKKIFIETTLLVKLYAS